MRYNRLYKDNNYLTTTTNTQELSEYTANLKFEDLPAEVVEQAKKILLHTIGAALAAKDTEIAAKVKKLALEANGGEGGPTTLWGSETKLGAVNAALVLGTLADTLEWADATHTGRPACGIIPCAWLAAEEKNKSGKDLITAIVAGYEVYQRIANAVQPSAQRWSLKGWGMTSWQLFGCILPIAKLYDMDSRKINQSIGMGCECSTLPTTFHATTMSEFGHYEQGYRTRDGFLVAKSVDRGIHNQRDALDESRCYTGIICGNDSQNSQASQAGGSAAEADVTWLTRDLGTRYMIMDTLLKAWPANIWAQAPVQAVYNLMTKHGFTAADVAEIIVDGAVAECMWNPNAGLESMAHAQNSIPYVIAAMLCDPTPSAKWYTPEMMNDANVLALAGCVKAGTASTLTTIEAFKMLEDGKYAAQTVTVVLKDGTKLEETVSVKDTALDCACDCFRVQAAGALDAKKIEKAIETICNIETVENIAKLAGLWN